MNSRGLQMYSSPGSENAKFVMTDKTQVNVLSTLGHISAVNFNRSNFSKSLFCWLILSFPLFGLVRRNLNKKKVIKNVLKFRL